MQQQQLKNLQTQEAKNELFKRLEGKEPALFFDYDGTLTPIVNDPGAALLEPSMREALRQLAAVYKVALVSGRDLQTLRNFVQLEEVYYAGSHGFDIVGPGGVRERNQEGEACREELASAEKELAERLSQVRGCEIERKAYAVAVHYRNVEEEDLPSVFQVVEEVVASHAKLRQGGGKKVFELRPDVDWDKGKAVLWLLRALGMDRQDVVPFYLGDDLTDEDGFRALKGKGVSIFVGELDRETEAEYQLDGVEQVKEFLNMMVDAAD